MYKEIEIEVFIKDGKKSKRTFNLNNINYYKPYVDTTSDPSKKDKLITMVYFLGSIKATRVNCSYDSFKRKIMEALNSDT